jgi:hypothetical protein
MDIYHTKGYLTYTAALKQLESCTDNFRQVTILTTSLLYIYDTIICAKEKCYCAVRRQINTYNKRNYNDYYSYVHNWELYNATPSVPGGILYNKLLNNIEQIRNNNQLKLNWKTYLLKDAIFQEKTNNIDGQVLY